LLSFSVLSYPHHLRIHVLLWSVMMVFAVPLIHAQMENVSLLQMLIDAVITTNAPSIDAQQLAAPMHQLFVMMVMLAPAINVIPDLENVFTLHVLAKILISAQSKLVMQN
jgi:hypothetical protein